MLVVAVVKALKTVIVLLKIRVLEAMVPSGNAILTLESY